MTPDTYGSLGVRDAPTIFRYLAYDAAKWIVNGGWYSPAIEPFLQARETERVLDVGCGTGVYSRLAPGSYVGIDTAAARIRYARRVRGCHSRTFLAMRVQELGQVFPEKHFDKAMVISLLHHLDDDQRTDLLRLLARFVRSRIVITDADPDSANWAQGVLIRNDPGKWMRPRKTLVDLVSQTLRIEDTRQYAPPSRCVVLTVLSCTPPP